MSEETASTGTPEHQHVHHGTLSHVHDYATANQKHFDAEAKAFDAKPSAIELAHRVSRAMIEAYPSLFNEDSTSVLDFACGTGLLSRELAPHVKSILGVDISQGMVDQYNLRVDNQGIPREEIHAIRAELKGNGTELDGQKFDVIVCAASYHHIVDINEITRILSSFLKPGGSLLIADILKNENSAGRELLEDFGHVVPHKSGFSEATMRSTFAQASLQGFEFKKAMKAQLHGQDVDFFLAKGVA